MASKFCRLLREAIVDETKAPKDYIKLIQVGSGLISTETAVSITSIAKQEGKHKIMLRKIAKTYCGGK